MRTQVFMASRLPVSLAVSALLHALALSVLLRLPRPTEVPALVVIPVLLVGALGGGGGGEFVAQPQPTAAPALAAVPPALARAARAEPTKPRARPRPAPALARQEVPAPAATENAGGGESVASGTAAGGSGGGAGSGGEGVGGDGSGGAGIGYGNPRPPYPRVARNLGIQGVVLLDISVTADGRVRDVRVLESSGYAPLDQSAVTTVRQRWRFPARPGDASLERRVRVPIRFHLEDARS